LAWKDRLPIYGPNEELLQYVSPARAQELLDAGLVTEVGTRRRTHRLIATRGSEEFLRADKPASPKRDVHNYETADNPRGVWTFRKLWALVEAQNP
jgi:hypothetical protein